VTDESDGSLAGVELNLCAGLFKGDTMDFPGIGFFNCRFGGIKQSSFKCFCFDLFRNLEGVVGFAGFGDLVIFCLESSLD